MTPEKWPGIKRAALEIALDNGGINRFRSEERQQREFRRWLEKQPQELLPAIDAWLSGLSDEDLQTVCDGEVTEADAILANGPPFTNQLLNDYFDEVC